MEHCGIGLSILSVTAPGACVLKGQDSFDLARDMNVEAAKVCSENPEKLGFFANLPDLLNTEAALAEIKYAIDELGAEGVTLFTR